MATAAKKKPEESKEVATRQEAGAVGDVMDYGEDAGVGFQNQTSDDQMIPFIEVLQGLSPSVLEEGSDAKPGMLRDTATGELYSGKTGIVIAAATTQHVVCEWKPREQGGGLVGRHDPYGEAYKAALKLPRDEKGKVVNSDGNLMAETFYIYATMADADLNPIGDIVIGCASTKIKPYRGLMTRLRKFTVALADGRKVRPPLFAYALRVKTIMEKRAKGDSYNIVFEGLNENDLGKSLLKRDHPLFVAAKHLQQLVDEGRAKADAGGGSGGQADPEDDGKAPF